MKHRDKGECTCELFRIISSSSSEHEILINWIRIRILHLFVQQQSQQASLYNIIYVLTCHGTLRNITPQNENVRFNEDPPKKKDSGSIQEERKYC